jgi:hypothetical protein
MLCVFKTSVYLLSGHASYKNRFGRDLNCLLYSFYKKLQNVLFVVSLSAEALSLESLHSSCPSFDGHAQGRSKRDTLVWGLYYDTAAACTRVMSRYGDHATEVGYTAIGQILFLKRYVIVRALAGPCDAWLPNCTVVIVCFLLYRN